MSKGRLAPCLLGVHFTVGEQASPRGEPRTVRELVRRAREKGKQRSGEDGGGRRRVPFHQGGQGGHTHTAYCPNQETRRGVVGGWQVSRRINWGTHFPYLADKGISEQKPHVQLEL